jgi:hypothetical protein
VIGFRGRARDQRRAEVLDAAHGEFHARILHRLEARPFDEHIVDSRNQARDPVAPGSIGRSAAREVGRNVASGDFHLRHNRRGGICDRTANGRRLCHSKPGEAEQRENQSRSGQAPHHGTSLWMDIYVTGLRWPKKWLSQVLGPITPKGGAGSGRNRRDRPAAPANVTHSTSGTTSTTRLKEKVKIKKYLPIVIAEETSVLRISHVRVDFQRIEMIGQVHHCCGQPNGAFGRDLDVLRGSKVK